MRRFAMIIGVPAVMCAAALMSAACQSKNAGDGDAAETTETTEEHEDAPETTQSAATDDADGLESFFADVKLPHYTVNDLLRQKEWTYSGLRNNGAHIRSATLQFKKDNNKIQVIGYGFWGTECGLLGSIENNRLVVKEDYENRDFINAPSDNMTFFISKEYDGFVIDWIESETYKKIKAATPTIVYKSADGDILKIKYYRDLWGNMEGKAFGEVTIENLSENFFKQMDVSNMVSSDDELTVSKVPLEYPFEFQLTKNNEIKMNLDLWEDGQIIVNPGIWSPDRITFPADKKKGLSEYVFTRQK